MKVIKKIVISLLFILLVVLGAGLILSFIFKEEVNELLIRELNKKIITKIDVDEVKFSLLRKFPNASIEFRQVLIHPPASFNQQNKRDPGYDTLIYAKHLFLEFNVMDVIRKDFRIKSIHADRGLLYLKVDREGIPNYQFWKTDYDTSASKIEIKLQDLKFSNLQVHVLNQVSDFSFNGFAESINLKGNFASHIFQLETEAKLLVQHLSLEGINYITDRMCRVDLEMTVEENRYTIDRGNVEISGLPFITKGSFTTGESRDINLIVSGMELDLPSVISMLPVQYKKKASEYSITGSLDFKVNLNGGYGIKSPPQIMAQVHIDQGSMTPVSKNIKIDELELSGYYSNGKKRSNLSTTLEIDKFSFHIGKSDLSGSFRVNNFEHPELELLIAGSLDLSEVHQFLQPDSIKFMEGQVQTNLKLSGPLKNYRKITRQDIQNLYRWARLY